ncbi:hypothetical protein OQ968_12785 [Mycobacterium sp. 663a-19]|uniref:hypothetical protein n=1 Tax=Mycobacterium sp. 663a-19 TaxID=2986148 RepID=UPI002D1EE9BB|nr:hypothetical protein [Mycobacterium sp. 663a-19]MEB3982140.1 hypothetical protein [Mycobacterium sp. 663a-19]
MSTTQDPVRTAIEIDDDVELITAQIDALKELAKKDDAEAISEGERYDFSIRWGTVLAGRLRRLVHYSSLGRLAAADERRLRALCDELRGLSRLIDRFRLAHPNFTDAGPATAKRFRRRAGSR